MEALNLKISSHKLDWTLVMSGVMIFILSYML